MRYAWIQRHEKAYPLRAMCRVLAVSPSGYYDWQGRRQRRDALAQAAARAQLESHRIYGYRKVWQELREQ